MPVRFWLGAALLAGSASVAPQGAFVPTGAKIEASGFATVEKAPTELPDEPPPSENRPRGEDAWYARDLGISVEEAARRRAEQAALMPEFERLLTLLRSKEAGNFTAPRIVHQPDWAYVFYFKRDPHRTLARYTSNPRFRAALARYSRAELQALMDPWAERFTRKRIAYGFGADETFGTANISMNVTEQEYRAIAAREGWGPVPDPVKLEFARPIGHAAVEERVRPLLRIFPQNDRATGAQLMAAITGRIFLRDGCLRVKGLNGAPDQLAFFHRETGIGIDEKGYLALTDRKTGKTKGRIGEWFTWAGPNGVAPDTPALAELRRRCGDAPVNVVGNPESTAQFRARPNMIDSIAIDRRVSRRRAWDLLKRCWARDEAAHPDRPPTDYCRL